MSNLKQFVGAVIPLGGTVTIPYSGQPVYTAPDGTQWYSNVPTAPFAYTSDYSYLPDFMTSPHAIMNGPESNGTWVPPITAFNIAYNPSSGLYVTSYYDGDATNGYNYYTSSNNGTTWTKRTFPNNKAYNTIQYTAGKFVACIDSTTTNGVITSTDGINWTSVTGVLLVAYDIVSDGVNNIVIMGSGTGIAYSTDGGSTWTSATGAGSFSSTVGLCVGQGGITWNAGAGLFIAGMGNVGAYQTSPTGATWTARNAQATYSIYGSKFAAGTKYASNATTTVAVGTGGFFATTTDGLTWSNHGYISTSNLATTIVPNQVYYDGTRFVARFQNLVFYSTNGTTWTQGSSIGGFTLLTPQSNGTLFGFPLLTTLLPTELLRVANVASTTRQTVISPVLHVAQVTSHIHYRIR